MVEMMEMSSKQLTLHIDRDNKPKWLHYFATRMLIRPSFIKLDLVNAGKISELPNDGIGQQ